VCFYASRCTLCSEKNAHSHFLLYLCGKCPDFHKIFKECLGGNQHSICEQIRCLCCRWHHADDVIFSCLSMMGFTIEDRHWWNVKTDKLVIVLTESKNMPISYTVFHFELFLWFSFLAECKIFSFADVDKHMCTASLHGWPLACYLSNIFSEHSVVATALLLVASLFCEGYATIISMWCHGAAVSVCSYINYYEQYLEFDAFITTPDPSNPWISDNVEFWEQELTTYVNLCSFLYNQYISLQISWEVKP